MPFTRAGQREDQQSTSKLTFRTSRGNPQVLEEHLALKLIHQRHARCEDKQEQEPAAGVGEAKVSLEGGKVELS